MEKHSYWLVLLFSAIPALLLQAFDEKEHGPVVRIKRLQSRADLVVPKSFSGRSGHESSEGYGIEILNRIEFQKENSKIKLSGRVSKFDVDTSKNSLKGLVWESRKFFPRRNSCMDCHGGPWPQARTQLWLGEETKELTPRPTKKGNATITYADGDLAKNFFEIKHWVSPHQALNLGLSKGRLRSFDLVQRAYSAWMGWNWMDRKRLCFSSELRASKAQLYEIRREFLGKILWKGKNGFSLGFSGGILLDGFGQYDVGFSDIGAVVVSTEQRLPENLPAVYSQLKTERFGYYSIQARYEYAF